jgi:hypothetical protein
MLLCSGLYAGTVPHRSAGNANAFGARSHDSSGNASHQQRPGQTQAAAFLTQMGLLALLRRLWISIWNARSLSYQIIGLTSLLILLLVAIPRSYADEYSDITLRSGVQLKDQFVILTKENPNVRAALQYYAKEKFFPNAAEFTEYGFRSVKTKEYYRLFFIPVIAVAPQDNKKRFILSARGPKAENVFVATVSKEEKEPPVITDEKQVIDQKVEPGKGLLKRVFKCSVTGCAGAAGCILSGPGWLPCFCLSCGTVIAACSITELFFP